MKEYIRQFYNEGLATIFYLKPVNYLNKKIKHKNIKKILCLIIKICYTILVLIFAVLVFYNSWPL
ncbi:MAG: hypothetical protein ACI4WU_05090 [Bacilli bacterium]